MSRKRAASSESTTLLPPPTRSRAKRARPAPRWLTGRSDLDEMACRRCLMILSVLSGEKPVSTAIGELGISRALYYQLETKALVAMLVALAPGSNAALTPEEAGPARRIAELEKQLNRLEQDKRRLERLLFLTRKVIPPGPITMPTKRGRKPRRASVDGGLGSSTPSETNAPSASPSTPTPDGETTP